MTAPYYHAKSSAKRFGGIPEDYLELHNWMDESKQSLALFTHRAVRHHAEGIFEGEAKFGVTITNSEGRKIPVRYVLEQHVREDCGGIIPNRADWLSRIKPERWMSHGYNLDTQKTDALVDGGNA